MKIMVGRIDDDSIFTQRDYSNIRDKGEIAHIICELESIKKELIDLWEEYDNQEDEDSIMID